MEHVEAGRRETLRRVCMVIAAFASLWAYVVALTDGFAIERGPLRLSSRSPRPGVRAHDPRRRGDVGARSEAAAPMGRRTCKWLSAAVARVVPEVDPPSRHSPNARWCGGSGDGPRRDRTGRARHRRLGLLRLRQPGALLGDRSIEGPATAPGRSASGHPAGGARSLGVSPQPRPEDAWCPCMRRVCRW